MRVEGLMWVKGLMRAEGLMQVKGLMEEMEHEESEMQK